MVNIFAWNLFTRTSLKCHHTALYGLNMCLFVYSVKKIMSRKTSVTWKWLVVESCPTRHLIEFLMLYKFVKNAPTHFNGLILAWNA